MAKALLGQRVYFNDRLVLESDRLRSRVRDLESMIEDLQQDNDRLRRSDNDRLRPGDDDRLRQGDPDRMGADLQAEVEGTPQHAF